MIAAMHIQNFKCFKDFHIDLDPFTVLIGPNDSGKTAFLQAIRVVSGVAQQAQPGIFEPIRSNVLEDLLGFPLGPEAAWRNDINSNLVFRMRGPEDRDETGESWVEIQSPGGSCFDRKLVTVSRDGTRHDRLPSDQLTRDACITTVGKAAYYRFDPRQLRQPSELKRDLLHMSEAGNGLPTFLQGIWGKNRDAFLNLEREFYARLPEYNHFRVEPKGIRGGQDDERVGQAIFFDTRHGESLSAESVSDGALITLAFLAIGHQPDPPNILLIEEPENGVHHARLEEIVRTLRELNQKKSVQIILTTHSPYLLDLAEPEDVRVFAKDQEGAVHARKLSDYPDVETVKKHFRSGEIWASLSEEDFVLQKGGGE